MPHLPTELAYILLAVALFVLPQTVQRLRLPTAITSLGLGVACGVGFGWFQGDHTIHLLAVFGIVALFLFAGLEVDFSALRRQLPAIVQHLAVRMVTLSILAWIIASWFALGARPAFIAALALLTPSTGFILSSLPAFGLTPDEAFLVKAKAIAGELLALAALFVCVQSSSAQQLAVAGLAMVGMIVVLPVAFWLFARYVLPHAPKSEFAFLVMLAIVCATTTRHLGAYYLTGAFIAGIIAQRTRMYAPELVSPRVIDAIECFASFFIPFYFFHAGLELRREDFGLPALAVGGVLIAVLLPLRLGGIVAHQRWIMKRELRPALRVATALLPTLVFTLVLAKLLRDQYAIPPALFGGLIIYTIANTLIPGLVLRAPVAGLDFTAPEAADPPAPRSPTEPA